MLKTLLLLVLLLPNIGLSANYVLIDNNWSHITLPQAVGDRDVATIFCSHLDCNDYTNTWNLFSYDPVANAYVNPALTDVMSVGQGFWILQKTGSDVTIPIPVSNFTGTPDVINQASCANGCTRVDMPGPLDQDHWVLIGNPQGRDIPMSQTRYVNTSQCSAGCGPVIAESLKLTHHTIFWFHQGTFIEVTESDSIPEGAAFWAYVYGYIDPTLTDPPSFPVGSTTEPYWLTPIDF